MREFQRRYSAQLQAYRNAYGAQMNEQLLRQLGIEQQILQQLVDEEAMVAEARRQGITVSDVGDPRAHSGDSGVPGERTLHRRGALPADAADQQSAADDDGVRRQPAARRARRKAAQRGHRLDVGRATTKSREEYRRRNEKVKLDVVPITPDAFKSQVTVTDAEIAGVLREAQGHVSHRREAQDQVRAGRRRAGARTGHGAGRRNRGVLQAEPGAVLRRRNRCARSHILLQDRRQGRGRRQGAGRRGPQARQGRRRFRRAGEAVSPRTRATTPRAATSNISVAARWCRSSSRPRSR